MTMPSSADLIAQIDRLAAPAGQLALWALGQAGFAIKGGDMVVYIDPYLSDSSSSARRFPAPIEPGAVNHARAVFATHEHLDHADGATLGPLMGASPQAVLVTSTGGRDAALKAGVSAERILTPRAGESGTIEGLRYTAIPAAHYGYDLDEQGRSRWMGFLIEWNGVTLYHSGDTIMIPQIAEALAGKPIDLALLPINGRDYYREQKNLIGNLWPGEAVELALQLGARVLLGLHNDMFAGNRVNPSLLFDEIERRAPFQRCHILQPGELYLYAG